MNGLIIGLCIVFTALIYITYELIKYEPLNEK